jgi:CARDB
MMQVKRRGTWVFWAALGTLGLALNGGGVVQGQAERRDTRDGPAPTIDAVEIEAGPGVYRESRDAAAAAPAHPPIHTIPPMRMPDETADGRKASGPGSGISHDARTGKTKVSPADFGSAARALQQGGGYRGADGGVGDEELPAVMSGPMTIIANPGRASHPWRMNVKLVMRWGASYAVCSGTMRDIATVLTAGHCIFDFGGAGWADEVWVYPAWDGIGDLIPAPTIADHYGWGHSTILGSWTGWTVNGDLNYDIGVVALDRAVGALTGWFGWHWGGDCSYWFAQTVHNLSYPAEGCGSPGLHNGRDMTYWFGNFDSCPDFNRIRLNTSPGCYTAIWGGQSGSGVYRIEGADSRYVHGITSTSNRTTTATYTRQWEAWVTYTENTFIPTWGRGAAFDLEPLDVNAAPTVVPAGGSVNALLNHLAVNKSNAGANGNWDFNVYLSSNDNIQTTDTLLSQQNYNWNFGPVSSVRVNMAAVTIPISTPPGNYFLGVIYDAGTDGNPANDDSDGWDAVPITVTKPDLDITALAAPATAEPGDVISVSNTVRNIGNASTGVAFRLGLYLSVDNVCTTGDTLIGSRNVGVLAAGGTSAANTNATIPAGATLGARFICGIADDQTDVAESNEGNNTAFDAITIVRPDLRISLITGPASASPGGGFNVSNTVGNSGTGPAGPFRVGLYLSADNICTVGGDTFLQFRNVAGLGVGLANNASTPVVIPPATPLGNRFLCAIADDLLAVPESNEGNNTGSTPISILPPTPILTLRVNGQHPTPPVVTTTGPYLLTLDMSATTYTAALDWYWALIVNGQTFWVTSTGLSTTPAPLVNSPPLVLTNATLLNLNLPVGTNITSAFFLLNGATVVSSDFISATVVP